MATNERFHGIILILFKKRTETMQLNEEMTIFSIFLPSEIIILQTRFGTYITVIEDWDSQFSMHSIFIIRQSFLYTVFLKNSSIHFLCRNLTKTDIVIAILTLITHKHRIVKINVVPFCFVHFYLSIAWILWTTNILLISIMDEI